MTEGSLAAVACLDGDEYTCPRLERCGTLIVWKKLYGAINDVVDGITLQDLVNQENARIDDYVI